MDTWASIIDHAELAATDSPTPIPTEEQIMSKLDDLRDQFDTAELLEAVDSLDTIRGILADGDHLEPPQIRTDLLKLHELAMDVFNDGHPVDEEMTSLAWDIESQVDEIVEAADRIQKTLTELVQVFPEDGFDDDKDEDE